MESSQKRIVNQTDRSLIIKCIAAFFFTAFLFLIFRSYHITFASGYDLSNKQDFVIWGKELKNILLAGVFVFAIGSYLAKRKRIIFVNSSKKYKVQYFIGPFHRGRWTHYEELKMIGIFKNSKEIYEVNIWFSNSRHIKFDNFQLHNKALVEAQYLAETLKLPIWDASDPKNPDFIK